MLNHTIGRTALLAVAAGALALAAAGCSTSVTGSGSPNPSESTGLGPAGTGKGGRAPKTATTGGPSTGPTTGPTTGPSTGPMTPPDTGPNWTPDQGGGGGHGTPQSRPYIVYLRVKQKPQCPQGTNLYPVPGRPLILEWKTTGAEKVDLSVDGPGRYNTYDQRGSEMFTFSCGGAPGTVETHTYTIKTVGGGPARTRTISVSATVHEITQVPTEP